MNREASLKKNVQLKFVFLRLNRLSFYCLIGILSLVADLKCGFALDLGWDSGAGSSGANSASVGSKSDCPQFFVQGAAPRILNPKLAPNIRLLCFASYAVGYSPVSRTPLWSAEHLSRESLYQAKGLKRNNAFHEEERLPISERSLLSDYARSGFDRGHMSPSADQPSEQAQLDSFSLANMVPQNPNNNRHLWEGIESATRTLAKSSGDLYIITGPLFIGSSVLQLHGRVMVPTHLFKIIYDPSKGAVSAYLVLNKETDEYSVISLEELTRTAGIDFMPALNETQKNSKIVLPTPTPHTPRDTDTRAGSENRSEGDRGRRDHSLSESPSQSSSEFRQVEHLLKEISHMIN